MPMSAPCSTTAAESDSGCVAPQPTLMRAPRERATAEDVLTAVAAEEAELDGAGRVLLRPSGTEPLVRVMVEAPTQTAAEQVARRLAAVVSR
jgi:phosphoglucosamine mutase